MICCLPDSLFFRGNDLKEDGAQALGTALACLTLLTNLDLRYILVLFHLTFDLFWCLIRPALFWMCSENNIGEAGAQYVALSLVNMTGLAKLWLGHNALGDDGGLKIAAAIKGRTTLKALDMM